MGRYIKTGNAGFREARNREYVDKSGLIGVVNDTLNTEWKFSCVSRARRFGKSMAAKMLCAFYDCSCDSRELFADLEIVGHPSFEKHLNKYPVLYLDMSSFVSKAGEGNIVAQMENALKTDIMAAYPDVAFVQDGDLMDTLLQVVTQRQQQFFFIIDEWDAICREYQTDKSAMDDYVNWLRRMFKDVCATRVFAGVYMTGILPIKKYRTQSALNNFREYSMVTPGALAPYFGFTKEEVQALAASHGMDFDEMEKWYDGYQIGPQPSMFNPNSVMEALRNEWCESYWGNTGAFDAITDYIQMDYEGLKDDIIDMLAGGRCAVDPKGFSNDLADVNTRDDVLTVLIHLGYLSYDRVNRECFVPNMEVAGELEYAIRANKWKQVVAMLQQSRKLLNATLSGDADTVAAMMDAAHSDDTSILSYNNENSLACVVSLAYYYARNEYVIHRELPTGKGYADLVLIPRKTIAKPAVIVELKRDKAPAAAISQIRQRDYMQKVKQYTDDILLVGISYDRDTKQHSCAIERWEETENN